MEAYTIAQAARRIGLSEQSVRRKAEEGELSWAPGPEGGTKRVDRVAVDELRTERLSKFGDVQDLSAAGSPGLRSSHDPDDPSRLRERIATLESQIRQIVHSRASINDGIQNLLRGEQGLLEAVVGALELDPSTFGGTRGQNRD